LQQQVQQATSPQQKAQFKNQLNDVHQEISELTQKQLKAFAEQNPEIKQPESELDQSRRRQLFVGLTCKLFARMLFQLTTDV
jgi:oligoendopeptidase F